MKHYIDKSALVAEIENKFQKYWKMGEESDALQDGNAKYWGGVLSCLNEVKTLINTLEVKEVDLEKEFDGYTKNIIACDVQFEPFTHLYNCAKHFFELGLSSQLSWKDIERIDEIGMNFMNSEDSDNLNDEEYYTEILNRFKTQEGE